MNRSTSARMETGEMKVDAIGEMTSYKLRARKFDLCCWYVFGAESRQANKMLLFSVCGSLLCPAKFVSRFPFALIDLQLRAADAVLDRHTHIPRTLL